MASSIPASEHSVMTSWPSEQEAMQNMIRQFGTGTFACVMDSYDYVEVRCTSRLLMLAVVSITLHLC